MLRSRSNRQQRASESSDERDGGRGGSSSSYGYRGYPSATAGPMTVGIASGADDGDYVRNNGSQPRPGRSPFGFGGGGGGPNAKKGSSFSNRGNGWGSDRRGGIGSPSPAKLRATSVGGGGGSMAFIVFSFASVLLLAMGGATFHYKRALDRIEHELNVMRARTKGHRQLNRFRVDEDRGEADEIEDDDGDGDGNGNDLSNEDVQEILDLRKKIYQLEGESAKWTGRSQSAENGVVAMETQMNHLEESELKSYEEQVASLTARLEKENEQAAEHKAKFMADHRQGKLGIVPGGPGHALLQKRELESFETLDDYEDYVEKREDALWGKIDVLVGKLGRESRREAEEWFGPSPHFVELKVEYPKYNEDLEPSDWSRAQGILLMEMANLSQMPVAVNLFLQQVHHGLWNGCSFVINAMHILQAGPHSFKPGSEGRYNANFAELVGRFRNARLDKMPFQEYSEDYPHSKYTVGFAGRPAGPDFYINKVDNSVNHGPGGQSHHDLHEEADPCFARLVQGMDILEDLNRIPVDVDRGNLLLHSVTIIESKVIASKRPKESQKEEVENVKEEQRQVEQRADENIPPVEQKPEEKRPEDNVDNGAKKRESRSEGTGRSNDRGGRGAKKMPAMGPGRLS